MSRGIDGLGVVSSRVLISACSLLLWAKLELEKCHGGLVKVHLTLVSGTTYVLQVDPADIELGLD